VARLNEAAGAADAAARAGAKRAVASVHRKEISVTPSKQFAEYFDQSPEKLGAEEIRQFQLHLLKEKKLAPGAVEGRMSALRFLYKKTLKRASYAPDRASTSPLL
jgi:hypothetical protein